MTEFNFSAAIGTAPIDQENGPLWSFNGVTMQAGPAGSVILHKRRGDKRIMVQPDVAEALQTCGPFRTIEAHTRQVIETSPLLREHADHTRQTLQTLADSGLFESSVDCWQRLTQNRGSGHDDKPCRLFVLTCDRPAALNRLLSGLREFPLPSTVESIWIVDDSRDNENIKQNASIIQAQAEGAKVPVAHVDLTMREDLIQHLKAALPEYRHSVEWFLERSIWGTQPTYGLARNLALLLCVGTRALVLDDDIIPQAVAPPMASKNFVFATPNEREAQFYESREALGEHALPLPQSPVAMMLEPLGKPLSSLISEHYSDHMGFSGLDGALLDRHSASSKVLIGQCGSWGDSGTANGNWIFNLPITSMRKLLGQSADLQGMLSARSLWLGYRGPAATQYGTLSQLTGLDHSVALPPYLPAGRGEDTLFGIMSQRLHPDLVVWNAGWAIRHENSEERAHRSVLSPISAKPGLSLLADYLGQEPRDHWGLSSSARLTGMAHQIRALATMDSNALHDVVREELISKRNVMLSRCIDQLKGAESMADLAGAPAWQAFLEKSRDQLVNELQTSEPNPLETIGAAKRDEAGMEKLREHGRQFADGLDAWPAVTEAATSFNAASGGR